MAWTGMGLIMILAVAAFFTVIIGLVALLTRKKKDIPVNESGSSYFDGRTLQLIGYRILTALISGITLGIAFPWAICMQLRWETKHTVINGRRLRFDGKGSQLIGNYLIWAFLTVFTLGIYSLWLGLNFKKWIVKHTAYADEDSNVESWFSGTIGGYIGTHLLAGLLTICTLGIGAAWGERMVLEWEARHTHIGGSPLVFSGTGGQLFVKYLLLGILTPLTLGIYAILFPVRYLRWKYSHTDAVYQTTEIQLKAKAHQQKAVQDYARFHLAANDTELSVMRSGITYEETPEQLEALAKNGNPYAMYRFSLLKRQASDTAAELEWLKAAADQRYYPAMLDYGRYLLQTDPSAGAAYLEGAARNGSCEAPWALKCYYQEYDTIEALIQQAYWFKVAMEWNDPRALEKGNAYKTLVKHIACLLSETSQPPAKTGVAALAAVGIGGVLLLLLIGALLVLVFGFTFDSHKATASYDPINTVGVSQMTTEVTSPAGTSETTIAPDMDPVFLVGDWIGWSGSFKIAGGMKAVTCVHISFSPDGTFTNYEMTHAMMEDGSYMEMVTRHTYGGDYRIDGDTLILHYTYFNSGSPDDNPREASTTHTISVTDGVMQISNLGYYDAQYDKLYYNMTVKEAIECANEAPTQSQDVSVSQIIGTWRSACREGNSIYTDYFMLNEDGTCECFYQRYDHVNYAPLEGESGWYVPPMGWPSARGTYTFDGTTLVLSVVDDYYAAEEIIYQIKAVEDGKLMINNPFGTYLSQNKFGALDVWALCEQLDVDISAD